MEAAEGLSVEGIGVTVVPGTAGAGVVITKVVPGGGAATARLRVGDRITAVGRNQVSDPAQFAQQWQAHASALVGLKVPITVLNAFGKGGVINVAQSAAPPVGVGAAHPAVGRPSAPAPVAFGQPAAATHLPAPVAVADGTAKCPWCAEVISPEAKLCPHCRTALHSDALVMQRATQPAPLGAASRSKTTAVLLAVFFAYWTWCYTYQRNKTKFWVGMGLGVLGGLLSIILVGFVVLFGVWLWAVIDAATTPEAVYQAYPYDTQAFLAG